MHYTTQDLPLMRETFEQDLWPILVEKLRCKGVAVEGVAPQSEQPASGPAPRQAMISDFFKGADEE